jgi:CRP-like cAMP-binding protein
MELLDDSFEVARASIVELARRVAELEERRDRRVAGAGVALARSEPTPPNHLPAGRLNVIDRLALLMEVPILRGAGVQPLSDLAVVSEEVGFQPGDVLFDHRPVPERVVLVVEGEVEAWREAPGLIRRAGAGQIVGGAAAFADSALAWRARATRRGRALAFRVEDWFDLMEEHFDMVRSALAALSLEREGLIDELEA